MEKITKKHRNDAKRIAKRLRSLSPRTRYCLAEFMSFSDGDMNHADAYQALEYVGEFPQNKVNPAELNIGMCLKPINMDIVNNGETNLYGYINWEINIKDD